MGEFVPRRSCEIWRTISLPHTIDQKIKKAIDELKEKELHYINTTQEAFAGKLLDIEARVAELEGGTPPPPPPPPPDGVKGTWLVYKASQPILNGIVEFDVTGLSSAGSSKDVMFVLTRGITRQDYISFRFDIRKYAEDLQLIKSVLGRDGDANESYWDNRDKIYWIPSHTYRFTINWDDNEVVATRVDLNTGETNRINILYPYWMTNGNFNPTYIMIGWNAKYSIPPGGYYSNISLPIFDNISYELVKYKS